MSRIFTNITDTRDDAERAFDASDDAKIRWGRGIAPHAVDLNCGHCITGHRLYQSTFRFVGRWPDHHLEATCECGQVLTGDVLDVWADHVREVRA